MKLFRIIFLLATATAAVNAIKCYSCTSDKDEDCFTISKGQTKHLVDCGKAKKCALIEYLDYNRLGYSIRARRCGPGKSKCQGSITTANCCICYTDGCNNDNHCTGESTGADTAPSSILFSLTFGSIVILMMF